jgi:hypothetical protein
MGTKFEQQHQYIDQRCDQIETALQGEITSLREEIARSNSNFVPSYSQSAFQVMQAGFISILAVSISKISGLNLDFDFFETPPASGPLHNFYILFFILT